MLPCPFQFYVCYLFCLKPYWKLLSSILYVFVCVQLLVDAGQKYSNNKFKEQKYKGQNLSVSTQVSLDNLLLVACPVFSAISICYFFKKTSTLYYNSPFLFYQSSITLEHLTVIPLPFICKTSPLPNSKGCPTSQFTSFLDHEHIHQNLYIEAETSGLAFKSLSVTSSSFLFLFFWL